MANVTISILNVSSVLTDDEVRAAIPALQTQVQRDFAPAWGVDAELTFVTADTEPAAGSWWLVILDNSDQAGALGYHDLTKEGLPLGKVFAATDIAYNHKWTHTLSHELLEMLADADINLTVFVQSDPRHGVLYSREVCDAFQAVRAALELPDGHRYEERPRIGSRRERRRLPRNQWMSSTANGKAKAATPERELSNVKQ